MERSVDGEPAIIYKFTPKYVLKTGSYVTVSSRVPFTQSCFVFTVRFNDLRKKMLN